MYLTVISAYVLLTVLFCWILALGGSRRSKRRRKGKDRNAAKVGKRA